MGEIKELADSCLRRRVRFVPWDRTDPQASSSGEQEYSSNLVHPPLKDPPITPYLGIRARLSQVLINRWSVLLMLVLVSMLITLSSLHDNISSAEVKALQACTKVEDIGSAMASMPHYLSRGVNSMAAGGITKSVQALMSVLDMLITLVEAIIKFYIHMLTDTYVCLITMAVHGSLEVFSVGVEKTTEAMNDAVASIAEGLKNAALSLQDGYDSVSSSINDAIDSVQDWAENDIPFGSSIGVDKLMGLLPDVPKGIDMTGIISDRMDDFKNLKIDSSGFVSDIDELNNNLPDFNEVRNLTNEAIAVPFDLIRKELTKAYGDWSFDEKVFPTAQKEALTFCSDNNDISELFEKLYKLAEFAKTLAVVGLVFAAIICIIVLAFWEIRCWRRERDHAILFAQNNANIVDLGRMYAHPTSSRFSIWLSNKFIGDPIEGREPMSGEEQNQQDRQFLKRQVVRWSVSYATSPAVFFVFSLAVTAFFSAFCKWLIVRSIHKESQHLANEVGDFAQGIVNKLTESSQRWADDTNGVIANTNNDLNEHIFGHITDATQAVNDTLNTFTDKMNDGIDLILGDTLFADAAKGVVYCMIGIKIESVEKGLTWVHDHAHLTLPTLPNDIFSMGASESIGDDASLNTFLSSPSSVSSDEITGAVNDVTNSLRKQIVQEALTGTGLLLVCVVIVLISVIYALVGCSNPNWAGAASHAIPEPPKGSLLCCGRRKQGGGGGDSEAAAATSTYDNNNDNREGGMMIQQYNNNNHQRGGFGEQQYPPGGEAVSPISSSSNLSEKRGGGGAAYTAAPMSSSFTPKHQRYDNNNGGLYQH